jgi:hypothetical protein
MSTTPLQLSFAITLLISGTGTSEAQLTVVSEEHEIEGP